MDKDLADQVAGIALQRAMTFDSQGTVRA